MKDLALVRRTRIDTLRTVMQSMLDAIEAHDHELAWALGRTALRLDEDRASEDEVP